MLNLPSLRNDQAAWIHFRRINIMRICSGADKTAAAADFVLHDASKLRLDVDADTVTADW